MFFLPIRHVSATEKFSCNTSLNPSVIGEMAGRFNRALYELLLRHSDGDNLLNVHILAQRLHGLQQTPPPLLWDETLAMIELEDGNSISWFNRLVICTRIINNKCMKRKSMEHVTSRRRRGLQPCQDQSPLGQTSGCRALPLDQIPPRYPLGNWRV